MNQSRTKQMSGLVVKEVATYRASQNSEIGSFCADLATANIYIGTR